MKILITGAGGFIGGWVAEYLHLSSKTQPRLAVRNSASLVRTARFGMTDVALADVLNTEDLAKAMKGVDAVFHCAMIAPSKEEAAACSIVKAMRKAGVKRLIYLSSTAVYGAVSGVVDEDTPLPTKVNEYARGKQDAERVLLGADGINVTLLRPTLVHGPYAKVWTENVARRVISGSWGTLGKFGDGRCNLVYVQDVAEAMLAAAQSDVTIGKVYNLNGPDNVTWNDYWSRLSLLLTGKDLPVIDPRPVIRRAKLLTPVRKFGVFMLKRNRALVMKIYSANYLTRGVFKATESNLKLFPVLDELESYARDTSFPTDRLRADSGYAPGTAFDEAKELSAEWLGLIGVV